MSKLVKIILALVFVASASAQEANVKKNPNTNEITEDLIFGADRSLTVNSGAWLVVLGSASFNSSISIGGGEGEANTITINSNGFTLEGATANAHETRLSALDPTSDNLQQLPDASGVLALRGDYLDAQAISFDGSSGATFGSTGALPSFTLRAWVKTGSATTGRIISGPANAPGLHLDAGGLSLIKEGVGEVAAASGLVAVDRWTCVAVTYDGSAAKFYIDGALRATVSDSETFSSGLTHLGVWGVNGTSSPYTGLLAKAAIFNYAASADEVRADYNRGSELLPEEKGASATTLLAGAWTNFSGGGFGSLTSADAQELETAGVSGGSREDRNPAAFDVVKGQRIEVTGTRSSGGAEFRLVSAGGTVYSNVATVNSGASFEATLTATGSATVYLEAVTGPSTGGCVFTGLAAHKIGAVWAMDAGSRNAGFQVADASGNSNPLNLPASGVSISSPRIDGGQVTFTVESDTGSLRARIPLNAYITHAIVEGTNADDLYVGSASDDLTSIVGVELIDSGLQSVTVSAPASPTGELWAKTADGDPCTVTFTFVLLP